MGLNKKKDCTICVLKTKALISCAVTLQLICAFVFAKQKSSFLPIYKSVILYIYNGCVAAHYGTLYKDCFASEEMILVNQNSESF